MKVEVILRETIKPSKPTPKHFQSYPLSILDHVNSPILMPLIFFYSPVHSPSLGNAIDDKMVSRLKGSLADTLTVFYPLAGRIKDDNPRYIMCNDEGVTYVQGRVNCRVSDVVDKVEVSELDKLLPSDLKGGGASDLLLGVQVNVFSCGGIALGLFINHKVSDAFSLYMFVKTWAGVAREGLFGGSHLLPFFGGAELFPLRTCRPSFKPEVEEVVTRRFVFSTEKIASIVSKFSTDKQKHGSISYGLGLLAFIYSLISNHSEEQDVLSNSWPSLLKRTGRKYEIFQAVNIRDLLDPPPSNHFYFGNVFVNAIAKPTNTTTKEDRFFDIVDRMREGTMKINANFIREIRDSKEKMNFMIEHFERDQKGDIITLGFSNHSKLPIFDSDFGWGRPIWVTSATLLVKNLIIFIPSPSGKELEVYLSLSNEDMNKLETDQEFISFTKMPLLCKF